MYTPTTRQDRGRATLASTVMLGIVLVAAACTGGSAAAPADGADARTAAGNDTAAAAEIAAPAVAAESADGEATQLKFDEFYAGKSVRKGLLVSDKLKSLDGKRVRMEGYMAPPLKAELDFFVLTRIRLAYCPFCSTAGDWPDDIAVVYLMNEPVRTTERPVAVEGRLELGAEMDPETGMVSLVRIYADSYDKL